MSKLFVIPTPIGNLEDITLRAIRLLKEVDLVLAEDTRTTKKLFNHFEIESTQKAKAPRSKWFIVDLPGYGYAKRSQTDRRRWEQMIEGYFKKRENLVQVFVLIDSRHGPQKNDLEFISQLDSWGIVFTLVFTKIDKEKPGVVKRNVEAFFNVLKESWQFLPRHFVTSAELKTGRPEMLAFIDTCNEAAKAAE